MSTLHYLDRAYERFGLGCDQASAYALKALKKGKRAEQMPKHEREYMEIRNSDSITTRYYRNSIFVFCDEECITAYIAPEWFCRRHTPTPGAYHKPRKRVLTKNDGYTIYI